LDLDAAFEHCAGIVRRQDHDRYISCLLAPPEHRSELLALYAFDGEISGIRDAVSQPMPGEIRLQWWRDAIEGGRREEVEAHPVAMALAHTMTRNDLPRDAFLKLLDARVFDLYDDPMPSVLDLEGYLGETRSALIRLGSIVLMGGIEPGGAAAAGHAGVALGIVDILRCLALHTSRGQCFLPIELLVRHGATRDELMRGRLTEQIGQVRQEMIALARHHAQAAYMLIPEADPRTRFAFLPLALVGPILQKMQKPDFDPFHIFAEEPRWRRQIRLWRAARRGF